MKDMKDLKEIRINDNNLLLDGNLVKGGILPVKIAELTRTVTIQANTQIDGPVYASKFNINNGDVEITGAVFTQHELYVSNSAQGRIIFRKAVASATSVTTRAMQCRTIFCSDINAKEVTLSNAFVAGSIYADDIVLENCVVIGGVFATNNIDLNNCILGTFNAPYVSAAGSIQLLLPTAFTQEPLAVAPGTQLSNLALADLGGLFRGNAQNPESGRIPMNPVTDDVKTTLTDDETRKSLHSYTVVGKVLAADLIDADKFQNHFLLSAAALGSQALKTYDLGIGSDGKVHELTVENISDFFFDILSGKVQIQPLTGSFTLSDILRG